MAAYVTLDGYIVRRKTDQALGIRKAKEDPMGEVIWVPRSTCRDGDILDVGDTDIECMEFMAEQKDLDY